MAYIALGARVLLALVFVTAASGKLADQPGTRGTLTEFGVSARWLVPAALLIPLAELATAAALLVQPSARWGAVAALGLLIVFGAGIASAMASGRAPDCHCFGQLSSAPAGRGTLIRNAILAAPAVFVVAYGSGEPIDTWLSARSETELSAMAGGVVAVALAAFCLRLWHDNRGLRRDLARAQQASAAFPPGLPVGAAAPGFALPNLDGQMVTLDALLEAGKPLALVFVSPTCFPCVAMFPDLSRWQTTLSDRVTVALLATGNLREIRRLAEEHELVNVLVQDKPDVFEAYRAKATPSAVIVTADGRIGSRTSSTTVLVEALIRRALHTEGPVLARRPAAQNAESFEVRQWSSAPTPG